MKKRRILTVMLLIVSAFAMVYANGAKESAAGSMGNPGEKVLRVGITADPGTLSPFVKSGSGFAPMAYVLYEYLGELSEVGGKLEGYPMKSYEEISPLVYKITLYDYVHDTAGNHITADDAIWSIAKMKEMGTNGNLRYIEEVNKIDDYTFTMKLTANFVGGFNKVIAACRVISKKAYEASPDGMATTPVGTTGYALEKYVPGSSVVFRKTNDFWQTDKSALATLQVQNPDVIEFQIIKESSQLAIALEMGTIDLALGVATNDAEHFLDQSGRGKGFKVFEVESNITNQMYLNGDTDSVFYNNLPLRQAVLRAIDKQGLVNSAVGGYGSPLHDFGSGQFPDYNHEWDSEDYNDYDPDLAKELLAKAGYKKGELKLRIMTDNTPIRNKVAQLIQGYLMAVGINSEILQYDQALFGNYKIDTANSNEWDIMLDNTGASDYLVAMYRGKFDANQYKNGTANGLKDPKLQAIVDRAIALDGHTAQDMEDLHDYMRDLAYSSGLFSNITFMVAREGIEDLHYDAKCYVAPANTVFNEKY